MINNIFFLLIYKKKIQIIENPKHYFFFWK